MEDRNCTAECKERQQACIPFFAVEAQAMHADEALHKFLLAIVAICIMSITMTLVFVVGYTIREKDRIDTIAKLVSVLEDYDDGVHEQSYP